MLSCWAGREGAVKVLVGAGLGAWGPPKGGAEAVGGCWLLVVGGVGTEGGAEGGLGEGAGLEPNACAGVWGVGWGCKGKGGEAALGGAWGKRPPRLLVV